MAFKVCSLLLLAVFVCQQVLAEFVLPMPVKGAALSAELNRAKRSITTICVIIQPSSPREEPYLMCEGAKISPNLQKHSNAAQPSSYTDNPSLPVDSSTIETSGLRPTIINTKDTAHASSGAAGDFQNPAHAQYFTQPNDFKSPESQTKFAGFQHPEIFNNADYGDNHHHHQQQQQPQQQLHQSPTPTQPFQFSQSQPTSFFPSFGADTKNTQFHKSPQYESISAEEKTPQHYSDFATKNNADVTQTQLFKQSSSSGSSSYHNDASGSNNPSQAFKTPATFDKTFQSANIHGNSATPTFNSYQSTGFAESKSEPFRGGAYSQSAFAATHTDAYDAKSSVVKTVPDQNGIITPTTAFQPATGPAATAAGNTYVVPPVATKTTPLLEHTGGTPAYPSEQQQFSYLPDVRGAPQLVPQTPQAPYALNVQQPIRTMKAPHTPNAAFNFSPPAVIRNIFQPAPKAQQPTSAPFNYLPPLRTLSQSSASNAKTIPTAAEDRYRAAIDDDVFDVPNWGFSADEFNLFRPMSTPEPIVSMAAPQRPRTRSRPLARMFGQAPPQLPLQRLAFPSRSSNIPLEHMNDPVMEQFYTSIQDTGMQKPSIQPGGKEQMLGANYGEPVEPPRPLSESQRYSQEQPLPQIQPQRLFNAPPVNTPNQYPQSTPAATPIYVQSPTPARCNPQPPVVYLAVPNDESYYASTKSVTSACAKSVVQEQKIQPIFIAIPCFGQQTNGPQGFSGSKSASYETVGMGNPLLPPAPLFPMLGLRNPMVNLFGPPGLFPFLGSHNPSADGIRGSPQLSYPHMQALENPFAIYAANPVKQTPEMPPEGRATSNDRIAVHGNVQPTRSPNTASARKGTTESEEASEEEDDEEQTTKSAKNTNKDLEEAESDEIVGANLNVKTNTTTTSLNTSTESTTKNMVGVTAPAADSAKKEEVTKENFQAMLSLAKKWTEKSNNSQPILKDEVPSSAATEKSRSANLGVESFSRMERRSKRKYMQNA